jgi:hypothetical protein
MMQVSAQLPADREIAARTDVYFNRTKAIVERFGDVPVTYAIFLRRPVIAAPGAMLAWLESVARARGARLDIEVMHAEGSWVGACSRASSISKRFCCRRSGRPALPRTTLTRCAWRCRKFRFWPWMRAIAPAPTCRI